MAVVIVAKEGTPLGPFEETLSSGVEVRRAKSDFAAALRDAGDGIVLVSDGYSDDERMGLAEAVRANGARVIEVQGEAGQPHGNVLSAGVHGSGYRVRH